MSEVDTKADEWACALPGLDLTHDMQFAMRSQNDVNGVIVALEAAGAQLDALHIQRSVDGLSARCRLRGLTPGAARDLLARMTQTGLAAAPHSLEHFLRAGGEAS